jgi:phenylalanine-4-hydroxylase
MTHTYVSHPVNEQGYVNWTDTENSTWQKLTLRQNKAVEGIACDEFIEGIKFLGFDKSIPQLPELNAKLNSCHGWGVEPVPAIIQPKEFFSLLANKKFPAATFIRIPEHMDYLQEPDIFHELYGHTPLLTNKSYCSFMEQFGNLALQANPKDRRMLFRLFWFTIEFGLIETPEGLRAYGGGILSSPGETQYCLTDKSEKQDFDALDALRTPYRIDIMQPLYFVINNFDQLFKVLEQDVLGLLEKAKELGDFAPKYPSKEEKPTDQYTSSDENTEGPMKC